MFQESLVESSSLLHARSRWPAVISFVVQALIAGALIALPLLHPEVLSVMAPRMTLVAPPMFKPVKPPVMPHVETSSAANSVAVEAQAPRLSGVTLREPGPDVQPVLVTGVNLAGPGTGLTSMIGSGPVGPRVVARPAGGSGVAGPLHVSTGVMAGQLMDPIRPEYPMIARISHTEGTVVVQAVISKTGRIESARVVSGPAVLQGAALEAVRAARYRPFLLNGLPTEVETTVSITFRMGG
ncbi:MAG: energy transducer TonB [Acidobacteriaceae bacterium]